MIRMSNRICLSIQANPPNPSTYPKTILHDCTGGAPLSDLLNLTTVAADETRNTAKKEKGEKQKKNGTAHSKRVDSKGLANDCKNGFDVFPASQNDTASSPGVISNLKLKREDSDLDLMDDAQNSLEHRPSTTHHAIIENRPWVLRYMLTHDRETLQNDFISPSMDETGALPLHLLAWSVQGHEILAYLLLHLDDDVRSTALLSTDRNGRVPLEVAKAVENHVAADLLEVR